MSTTLLDSREGRDREYRAPELARRRRGSGESSRPPRGRPAGPALSHGPCDGPDWQASHTPVLAAELLEQLDPQPGQLAIDCTFGDGGHARLLAERLGSSGTLVAIDRDPLAEQRFAALAAETTCSLRFIRSGYAEALELLTREGVRADMVYFDLGMSSMQVDTRERGFSYSYEAPLDMRMDPAQELSARQIVAEWDERRLAHALRDFGEERHSSAIARAIVRRRERAPIETTLELVDTINSAIPVPARFAGGHPAKRSFQALRIAVNDELAQLDRALPLAWGLLREGGVLASIAFHSLEDRRVKRFLAERARGCICPPELARVRVRSRAPGGAARAPLDRALRRGGGPQSARGLGALARRQEAGRRSRGGAVTPPAAAAAPAVRRGRTAVPARPVIAPRRPRRVSGPTRTSLPPGPDARLRPSADSYWASSDATSLSRHQALDRLIRGRTWIALIAFALIGIVTLQLLVLKLNANIGRALEHEARLQRENAALSIESSELAAGERVEAQAARLGMELVPVGDLRFLAVDPRFDIARAAAALSTPVHTSGAGSGEAASGAAPGTSVGATSAAGTAASTEQSPGSTANAPPSIEATGGLTGEAKATSGESGAASVGAAPSSSAPTPSLTPPAGPGAGAAGAAEAASGGATGGVGGGVGGTQSTGAG